MSDDFPRLTTYHPSFLEQSHPTATVLNEQDQKVVLAEISQRFGPSRFPEIEVLADQVRALTPRQLTECDGIRYIYCERPALQAPPTAAHAFEQSPLTASLEDRRQNLINFIQALKSQERPAGDVLYIAEQLPETEIDQQLAYFDISLQPLMRDFLMRFAGSGEEMRGVLAGQFEHRSPASLAEIIEREPQKACVGEYTRQLYVARNFDSVFIRPDGATVWHSYETNEITAIAPSFAGFLRHYAQMREQAPVFDSWSSRKVLGR